MRRVAFVLTAVIAAAIGVGPTGADSGARSYDYHVCDAFLDAIVGFDSRCVARASNGDVFDVEGTGSLAIHPKSVSGGGVFEHRRPDGSLVAAGAWQAVKLLSFTSYGPGDPALVPQNLEGGQALILITLVPREAPPGTVFEGVLQIHCLLPGARNPGGAEEGVRVNVKGGPNFNEEVNEGDIHAATVFVRTG